MKKIIKYIFAFILFITILTFILLILKIPFNLIPIINAAVVGGLLVLYGINKNNN